MDRLKFDGNVITLYAHDYEQLQDYVEAEIRKVTRATITENELASVIRGFTLRVSTVDDTKIEMYHDTGVGTAVTYDSIVIQTDVGKDEVSLSDYTSGVVNYIYLKYYQIDASYDLSTKTIVEGEKKAIDLADFSLEYNRSLDRWSVVAYTQDEYIALTDMEQHDLICLGSVTAQGSGNSLTAVSTDGRVENTTYIAKHSMTYDSLATDFSLPQDQVDSSNTINDHYTGAPTDTEDDLNKIRTQIRKVQGTFSWDDEPQATLLNYDRGINKVHFNGLLDFQDNFQALVTSSGTAIQVKTGKGLFDGNIVSIVDPNNKFNISAGNLQYVGDWSTKTGGELHSVGAQPDSFTTAHNFIRNLHIIDNSNPSKEYVAGVDFTANLMTGEIVTILGGDISGETLGVFYEWGQERFDLLSVDENGVIAYTEGAASDNPVPPGVAGSTEIKLYYIYREPMVDTITTNNLIDCRIFIKNVRELSEIFPSSYNTTRWTPNRFGYIKDSDYMDEAWEQWSLITSSGITKALTLTKDAKVQTAVYVDDNDELWLRAYKGPDAGEITISVEETSGSNVLDGSYTINLNNNIPLPNQLLFVMKGLSRGYHNVQINNDDSKRFEIYSLISGKLDSYYNNIGMTSEKAEISKIDTDGINMIWKPNIDYFIEDTVVYNNIIYICIVQHKSGSIFDITKWQYTNVLLESDYHDIADPYINDLRRSISANEYKIMQQALEISYLMRRKSTSSDYILETFMDNSNTADFETAGTNPAQINDDTDWGNNWEFYGTEGLDYKPGNLTPRKLSYLGEHIHQYNLTGVGLAQKRNISRYDNVNDCYWLITHTGSASTDGKLVKISSDLQKGKAPVLGLWTLELKSAITGSYWSGIDVDLSNSRLLLTIYNDTGTINTGGLLALTINDDDTLGLKNVVSNGLIETPTDLSTIDGTDTYHYSAYADTSSPDLVALDVTIWDDDNIAVLEIGNATGYSIGFSSKLRMIGRGLQLVPSSYEGEFNNPTATDITALDKYVISNVKPGYGIIRDVNTLWFKSPWGYSSQYANYIYKIDIDKDIDSTTNTLKSVSNRLDGSRLNVVSEIVYGGITIAKTGDILEVVSTSNNGTYLATRALKNTLISENQILEEYTTHATLNLYPNAPVACAVESDRYLWTGDSGVTANEIDMFRYDPETDTYLHVRINSGSWVSILDIDIYNDNLYLLGKNSSLQSQLVVMNLSTVISSMSTSGSSTISLGTVKQTSSETWTGIAYCYDDSTLYILNDSTDKLDSTNATGDAYQAAVYDLATAEYEWKGLTYKNNKFYIGDNKTNNYNSRILEMDKIRSTSDVWYISHIYQSPIDLKVSPYMGSFSFKEGNLVIIDGAHRVFLTMATLENVNALQLQNFILYQYSGLEKNKYSLLQTTNLASATPIVKRYFSLNSFSDYRNIPDNYYSATSFSNSGFSLYNMDEFVFNKNIMGLNRYIVSTIRNIEYIPGNNNIIPINYVCTNICIEKDMIFATLYYSGNGMIAFINLKSGITCYLSTAGATYTAGQLYNGELSEKNDGKGVFGETNPDLQLAGYPINTIAKTFTKNDATDYNQEYPVTFLLSGTSAGPEITRIDWGPEGPRTPIKTRLISGYSTCTTAMLLADSGYVIIGDSGSVTGLIAKSKIPIWDLIEVDDLNSEMIDVTTIGSFVIDIAPNSYCYKETSGQWKHILFISTRKAASGYSKLQKLIIENPEDSEDIFNYAADTYYDIVASDVDDEYVIGIATNRNPDYLDYPFILKKEYFADLAWTGFNNNWSAPFNELRVEYNSRSFFTSYRSGQFVAYSNICNFSTDLRIATFGSYASGPFGGLQFIYLPYNDNVIHDSILIECDNPKYYNYLQEGLKPTGKRLDSIPIAYNNITYYDGYTQTWGNLGAGVAADAADDLVENASNIYYASGTFGNPPKPLKKDDGSSIKEGSGKDYQYGQLLNNAPYDIYDDNLSGAFSSGKYFRIIEGGANITNFTHPSGSMDIRAINMSGADLYSPPSGEAWVDPQSGKFALPTPVYFSHLADWGQISNPQIAKENSYYSTAGTQYWFTNSPVKFGTGIVRGNYTYASNFGFIVPNQNGTAYIYPRGSVPLDYSKGTLSVWIKGYTYTRGWDFGYGGASATNEIDLLSPSASEIKIRLYNYELASGSSSRVLYAYVGGTTYILGNPANDSLNHIYAVWDNSGGLSGGNTVRIWVNGVNALNTTIYPGNLSNKVWYTRLYSATDASAALFSSFDSTSKNYISNYKMWDHVVTEDPSFEWNLGAGRQNALHSDYGATNNYYPIFTDSTSPNSGVGYYYVVPALNATSINEDLAIEGYLIWDNITDVDFVGIYFLKNDESAIANILLTEQDSSTGLINENVDLYYSIPDLDEGFVYWIEVDRTKIYTLKVSHSGTHNANASGSDFPVQILKYYTGKDLDSSQIKAISKFFHSDHEGYSNEFELEDSEGVLKAIELQQDFAANGTTDTFILSGNNRAAAPLAFGYTSTGAVETIWETHYSLYVTWGSNAPDYDNETIDSEGHFGVVWLVPPPAGTAHIKFIPKADSFKITTRIVQSNSEGYVENRLKTKLLNYSLELD